MKALVIDGTTTIGFVLKDEQGPHAVKALAMLEGGTVTYVPAHWCVEVANGLTVAERRKRASQADITEALNLVAALPVLADDQTAQRAGSDTAALARQYGLTIYDAAYLDLATTDRELARAARAAGVALLTA